MSGVLENMPPDSFLKKPPVLPGQVAGFYDDRYIAGWTKLIDVIHSYDVKIGAQFAGPGPLLGEGPSPSPFPDESDAKFGFFDFMAGAILPVQEMSLERMDFIKDKCCSSRWQGQGCRF